MIQRKDEIFVFFYIEWLVKTEINWSWQVFCHDVAHMSVVGCVGVICKEDDITIVLGVNFYLRMLL